MCRKVEELIDNHIDYADMTGEEIALVIDYKADIAACEKAYFNSIEETQQKMAETAAKYEELADAAKARYDALVKLVRGE